jgi:hypothetical protein
MERARRGTLLPYIKRCYIPVCHTLDYTIDWDTSNALPPGCHQDMSEYGDYDISSLKRIHGERPYIRQVKHNRMTQVIDIVQDYDQLEDGTERQPLEYWEKFFYRKNRHHQVGRKF